MENSSLKNDFLAAYQSILFSKTSGNEVDVQRRRVAVKYMTARESESEETAMLLLNQGLKQYEAAIDKTGFLKKIPRPQGKDKMERRTSLRDVQKALSLVKQLPCQKKITDKVCGRRELVDRDVENLMKLSETTDESVVRKMPLARPTLPPRGNPERPEQHRPPREQYPIFDLRRTQKEQSLSRFDQHRPQREQSFSRSEQNQPQREQSFSKFEQHQPQQREQSCSRFDQQRVRHNNDLSYDSRARILPRNEPERTDDEDYSRFSPPAKPAPFRTAKAELHLQQQQQQKQKKSLGGRAAVNSKFVCPFKREKEREEQKKSEPSAKDGETEQDERLRGIDEKLVELVRNEIMDSGASVSWDDVAGLEHAKKIIREIVVLPMLRPDIFTGLRRPPKGILLFGPPGTGKTLIGKCIASQSRSTFFSISASSLTSKWIGEGEKMVRALFAVARVHQPSVIFMDEIDSLLTQRSETEHESSRRIKTEFLVQLDGAATGEEDRILVIGATNRPQELDEAARRRFVKRLYVPLPDFQARRRIVENLLAAERHELGPRDVDNVAALTDHYSGADMTNVCKEASMGPIRSIPFELLENIRKEDVRCVTAEDFSQALAFVRPSVSQSDLGVYVEWDRTYGSGAASFDSPKPID